MNRFSLLLVGLSVLAVGCAESSPVAPSQGTQTTSTFTVIALTVTKDDSGTITSATANFQITVTGFPAGTVVTDAHIHNGAPGVNASIYVNTGLASGEMTLTNGGGSITKNGINVPSDRAAAILNNPAGHYFNVHTLLNAAGAIRGQLAGGGASFDPGTPVPY